MKQNISRNTAIGSQLYINKGDTAEQVRGWIDKMSENGLRLVRLFMIWDQLEPEQDVWNFEVYDACFDRAAEHGMGVIPTLMCVSPPGWMKISGGTQDIADLDDPSFRKKAMSYVEKLAMHYCEHPALHSWILWNEPSRTISQSKFDRKDFAKFLREYYHDNIAELNRVYFNTYTSFEEFEEGTNQSAESLEFKGYAEKLDFMRYTVYNMNCRLSEIAEAVRKVDCVHPVHVNPHALAYPQYQSGQSVFEEAKTVDFIGCSAHPSWHSIRFPQEKIGLSVAYFADLMKSAVKGERFWVSELQGGTNIFSGLTYLCPSAADIRQWLWESFGSGAEAVLFWCFNVRNSGFEGGEWGLLNQLGEPSRRLMAVKETADIIAKNQALFDRVSACKPDIWILYSDISIMLSQVEARDAAYIDNPRNPYRAIDSVVGAYLMCAELGYSVRMINEEGLRSGKLPEGACLIMPGCYALEKGTAEAVAEFVKEGGTVLADGLCGMKDAFGFLDFASTELLSHVFGAAVEDIEADKNDFYLEFAGENLPGWFLRLMLKQANTAQVEACFADKTTAVVRNRYGKGTAVRIGTVMFQQYLCRPSEEWKQWLKNTVALKQEIYLENPDAQLRLKVLTGEAEELCIIINRGAEKTAALNIPENREINVIYGMDCEALHSEKNNISVKEDSVSLIWLKHKN